MEKFGIFELLDALAAVSASTEEAAAPQTEEGPSAEDSVFAPPDYSAAPPSASTASAPSAPEEPASAESAVSMFPPREDEPNALTSLLERHEKIARRVDKK